MKVLEDPTNEGAIRIRIDSPDDLWYIHQVLEKGNIVGSHTFRKLESKDDMLRSDNQPRIRVYLKIRLEESEFHPFTDALRIKGSIVEGPPDISGHHTINANMGSILDIWKEDISQSDRELIDDACRSGSAMSAIAVSIDDESAEVYRLREYGAERIAEVRSGQGGKMYKSDDRWAKYYEDITEVLMQSSGDDTLLIISGPGFFKEKLSKALTATGSKVQQRIHLLNSSSGGLSGLKESLSSGKGMSEVVGDIRFVRENQVMEDLMSRIGKGSGAAYGIEEVSRALEIGAVEVLLITDALFKEKIGKDLLEKSRMMGSSSMIISTSHEMGEMLGKIGGAGALLRFELNH